MRSIQKLFSGHRAARGGRFVGRQMTHDDMMTFDRALASQGGSDHPGVKLPFGVKITDAKGTTRVVDSTGAFLVGELERMDMTLHGPLAAVSWGRDIDLREDVTIADEISSFTVSTFASSGSLGTGAGIGTGKAWIGKDTNQIAGVGVDIAKLVKPLRPWALELKYTILEIESAARLGRPIDVQKFEGLQLKHQMDIDEQVYVGDSANGDIGLINADTVVGTKQNVVAGATGFTQWANKSADEILADINTALVTVWAAAGWAVMSSRILIPPAQYGQLSTQKVSLAGNVSLLRYVLENNLLARSGGPKLEIFPLKWAIGAATGGTLGTLGTGDRMILYEKDYKRVRYPMTMLQRTPIQYDSIYHKTTYFCKLGVIEMPYPQTLGYFDGI